MRLNHLHESIAEVARKNSQGKYANAIMDYELVLPTTNWDERRIQKGDRVRVDGKIYIYESAEKGIGGKPIFSLKDEQGSIYLAFAEQMTIIERVKFRFSIRDFLI